MHVGIYTYIYSIRHQFPRFECFLPASPSPRTAPAHALQWRLPRGAPDGQGRLIEELGPQWRHLPTGAGLACWPARAMARPVSRLPTSEWNTQQNNTVLSH